MRNSITDPAAATGDFVDRIGFAGYFLPASDA